ncbi:MAG: translation initiation factor IF-6 [Candidatus Hydrothermarchaeales archaeon]
MIKRLNYGRNPNIGVFIKANDSVAIVPKGCPKRFSSALEKSLEVEVHKTNISGTSLIGAMIAMNNNGIVLPRNAFHEEVERFKDMDMSVGVLDDKFTALGNLMVINDNGGVVSPNFTRESIKTIEDTLDIEVEARMIAGFRTIGSIGIATNKGAIIHPTVSEEELEFVESTLRVYVDVGTINRGVGFVRTGIVANSNGAIMGEETTGPEIARIEDVLGFLE